MYMYLRSEVV